MTPWMNFLLALTPVLWDLYEAIVRGGAPDPELEHQLALRIVRAAKDAQARAELT